MGSRREAQITSIWYKYILSNRYKILILYIHWEPNRELNRYLWAILGGWESSIFPCVHFSSIKPLRSGGQCGRIKESEWGQTKRKTSRDEWSWNIMAGWDKCKVFCAWLSSEPMISFLKKKKKVRISPLCFRIISIQFPLFYQKCSFNLSLKNKSRYSM